MTKPLTELNAIQQGFHQRLRQTHIVQTIFAEKLKRGDYIRYLIDAHYYASFSPKVMRLAAERCEPDYPALSMYLLHHAEEETGHDEWARQDLLELGLSAADIQARRPSPACSAMVGYVHFLAGTANPVSLFGWMYVLEAMGDNLGPTLATLIRRQAGVPESALRFVAGHAASDQDHCADLKQQIEQLIQHDADYQDICYAAQVVSDLYTGILQAAGREA